MNRRQFTGMLLAGVAGGMMPGVAGGMMPGVALADDDNPFAAIERRIGGRLGVAILDTGSGRTWTHRGDDRFPMCSTFKAPLAAAVLARVDEGLERLDRHIMYTRKAILPHSPVSEAFVGKGMSVGAMCDAIVTQSDNGAANLLLETIGGPAGFTRFMRGIGDDVTRLDRWETELNEAKPGDVRDTTTPSAMTESMRRLVLGDALSGASRSVFRGWLAGNTTGDRRLRAGVPQGWVVGDKTGTGGRGTVNDIGVFWPSHGGGALVVSAYVTGGTGASTAAREAAIAEVARIAVAVSGRAFSPSGRFNR